jgi:hypothetical protein
LIDDTQTTIQDVKSNRFSTITFTSVSPPSASSPALPTAAAATTTSSSSSSSFFYRQEKIPYPNKLSSSDSEKNYFSKESFHNSKKLPDWFADSPVDLKRYIVEHR